MGGDLWVYQIIYSILGLVTALSFELLCACHITTLVKPEPFLKVEKKGGGAVVLFFKAKLTVDLIIGLLVSDHGQVCTRLLAPGPGLPPGQ